jgi:hypothetical protein
MIRIALNETHAIVLDGHLDAASARAHVAGAEMRLLAGTVVECDLAGHER